MVEGSTYEPSWKCKLVGGLQWSITGFYVLTILSSAVFWYLSRTRTEYSFDGTVPAVVLLVALFVAGYLWVKWQTDSPARERFEHLRRVEVVLLLFVLGMVLQFVLYGVLALMDMSLFDLPFFLIPVVTTGTTVLLSYGLVYGLDLHLLVSPDSA